MLRRLFATRETEPAAAGIGEHGGSAARDGTRGEPKTATTTTTTRTMSGISVGGWSSSGSETGSLRGLAEKVGQPETEESPSQDAEGNDKTAASYQAFLLCGPSRSYRSSLLFQPPLLGEQFDKDTGLDQALRRVVIKYIETHEALVAYLGSMHVTDPTAHTVLIDDLDLFSHEALDAELSQGQVKPSEEKAVLVSTHALALALAQSACKAFARGIGGPKRQVVLGVVVNRDSGASWNAVRSAGPWIPKENILQIRQGELRRDSLDGATERVSVHLRGENDAQVLVVESLG
ncbi:Hypothetical Protein FCC1311_030792 [Hondaea fermentalgiana]|uniref:Uncharacterized protein n=1 Tax=Hondaea fermentalgiana TaxID=2315210 RepID=A0A2R5G726_9STRA|nr:Hypothetical Protein FCC1311_030792 [Hondaea fermentalgiana]|eukprot:GBG26857.1 Hypothetical Protein FCC1311_030792 [Hondaea fermentalgiana]